MRQNEGGKEEGRRKKKKANIPGEYHAFPNNLQYFGVGAPKIDARVFDGFERLPS